MPRPTHPIERGGALAVFTFDEVEEALGRASSRLLVARRRGEPTSTLLETIDNLLDSRSIITSVWMSYAERGVL